jgi:sn1-specific diacylglycerol lipase
MITGHSLGAGIAVLLAIMLKDRYPYLQCFGYGVPGGLIDLQSAQECKTFVTSIVLGNDIIPRMSFRSLCLLRNEVLDCIARAKVNKITIIRSLLNRHTPFDELMYRPGEEPQSAFKESIERFKGAVQPKLQELAKKDLGLPGVIVHFIKTRSGK